MREIWQKIKRCPIMVLISKAKYPFFGRCLICGLPWPSCKPMHTIDVIECTDEHNGSGFFCVCEHCWRHAGLSAILTAVRRLYNEWSQQDRHPYNLDEMIEATKRDYFKESDKMIAEAMKRHLIKED